MGFNSGFKGLMIDTVREIIILYCGNDKVCNMFRSYFDHLQA